MKYIQLKELKNNDCINMQYMKNQNLKLKEEIKETIVLFSNNCYPLVDVYNLRTIINKLQCSNISQHKKWATTQQA
jgi:hypothetical protein